MLTFTKATIGYQADVDPSSGVTRWIIAPTAPKRWEIVSITAEGARIRHGSAYTLRSAKTIVDRWHQSNLAHAARESAETPHRLTAKGFLRS